MSCDHSAEPPQRGGLKKENTTYVYNVYQNELF